MLRKSKPCLSRIERPTQGRCHGNFLTFGSPMWRLNGCGRRVAILYGGAIFACRRCYQLAYASSREDAGDRIIRRADRLRARLGWEPGIFNGEADKPKWMRWRTFERLSAEYDALVGRSMQELMLKLKGFKDYLE